MEKKKKILMICFLLQLFIFTCFWVFMDVQKPHVRPEIMYANQIQNNSSNSVIQNFLRNQIQRLEVVRNQCQELLRSKSKISYSSFQHIIYDKADSITFCPIYKSASTSWTAILLLMRGAPADIVTKEIQGRLKKTFKPIPSKSLVSRTIDTTKFIVVRHPFERIISCYRDKFKNGNKDYYYKVYGEEMVSKYRSTQKNLSASKKKQMLKAVKDVVMSHKQTSNNLTDNVYANPIGPTFEEFIKFVLNNKRDDEHWVPYYKHCGLCHINYDFILKFETLHEDSSAFLQYINRSEFISDRWDNPTSNGATTTEVVCEHFSQISPQLLIKLIKKYHLDFSLFGYDSQDYFKCTKNFMLTLKSVT